jgi:hypothetical protein
MELSKYPVEKVFFFVAGIIPGFVALLIFHLAAPGSFGWFFTLPLLGYKTKLIVILLAAFISGNSLTTFLNFLLQMGGGFIGVRLAKKPFQSPETLKLAPWRDMRWRVALRSRLGAQAPKDTTLIGEAILNLRRQTIDLMPEAERPMALAKLTCERLDAEMDELKWAGWYDHYHQIVLTSRDRWDVQRHVMHGLNFNLETAALYALASVPLVPALRHWWCILPASIWILILVGEQYGSVSRYLDQWTTLTEQIEILSADHGGEKPADKKTTD